MSYIKGPIEVIQDTPADLQVTTTPAIGATQDVAIQDQDSPIVDWHVGQEITGGGLFVLYQDVTQDAYTARFTLATGGTILIGLTHNFYLGSRFFQAKVVSLTIGAYYEVTYDTPMDFAWTTATSVEQVNTNMNVDGSTGVKTFRAGPLYLEPGTRWDIIRVTFQATHPSAGSDDKFMGIAALTRGMVLRKRETLSGPFYELKTYFNAKDNGHLALHLGGDVTYQTRTGGGDYGTRARRTFNGMDKNGAVVRLNSDDPSAFEILIQDDLTALTSFEAVVQGHVVVDP